MDSIRKAQLRFARGGYSHTIPTWVCFAQRGDDFGVPDLEFLERGIHVRDVFLEGGAILRTHEIIKEEIAEEFVNMSSEEVNKWISSDEIDVSSRERCVKDHGLIMTKTSERICIWLIYFVMLGLFMYRVTIPSTMS